ncbi:exported hypothetical protein [Gammaproteobacteria bacterium]
MKKNMIRLTMVLLAAVWFIASTSAFSNHDVASNNGYPSSKINGVYSEKLDSSRASDTVRGALSKLKTDFDAGKTADFIAAWEVLISVSESTNDFYIGKLRVRLKEMDMLINSIKAKTDLGKERVLNAESGKKLIEEMKYFGLCDDSSCSIELAEKLIQNSKTNLPSLMERKRNLRSAAASGR